MNPLWTLVSGLAVAVLTAALHMAISRGYLKRAVEQYDKNFETMAAKEDKQDADIKGQGERLAVAEAKLRCPLPGCPMQLHLGRN